MRIAVVLDATAVRAYARSSISVGEILAEITDGREDGEQVCAALPAASLLASLADVPDDDVQVYAVDLYRLANHPAVMIVSTLPHHAIPAVRLAVQLGVPSDTAAAALLALQTDAQLLTDHADEIRSGKDPNLAEIPIDIEDD